MIDVIVACFEGFGVSPETSALIMADGLVESKRFLDSVFDLEEIQSEPFGIEHDCSFSRKDSSQGDITTLDPDAWRVTLNVIRGCTRIDAECFGRARIARIKAERRRNLRTKYNKDAAAYGSAEVGMLLGVYGTSVRGEIAEYCIRHLFEQERIPRGRACRPTRITSKFDVVMQFAVSTLKVDPMLQWTSNGLVKTRHVSLTRVS